MNGTTYLCIAVVVAAATVFVVGVPVSRRGMAQLALMSLLWPLTACALLIGALTVVVADSANARALRKSRRRNL